MNRHKCNEAINSDHDNMIILCREISDDIHSKNKYYLKRRDVMDVLLCMKSRKVNKCWFSCIGVKTVGVIECEMDRDLALKVITCLRKYYDKAKPHMPQKITDIQKEYFPLLDDYLDTKCHLVGEFPKVHGNCGNLDTPRKFSAYHVPKDQRGNVVNFPTDEEFKEIAVDIGDHIEDGFNFLRVEASEILAFVITDSDRVCKPGIPPHIPIAYGMRGPSLPMVIMRNMVNDIRDELKNRKCTILCEVYDGQFHPIIVRSESGEPLTRLQLSHDHFRSVMSNNTREDLVQILLAYSSISDDDISSIEALDFHSGNLMELDTVTIYMNSYEDDHEDTYNQIFLKTNYFENFRMGNIKTKHREQIWRKFLQSQEKRSTAPNAADNVLSKSELSTLIRGTKLHRRITRHNVQDYNSDDSEDDLENVEDPDYVPSQSESSDSDIEAEQSFDIQEMANTSVVSTTSTGISCIKQILQELKTISNKHNWSEETVDTFLKKYMSSRSNIAKLFIYELDVINRKIHENFNKVIFQKSDPKAVKVSKLQRQLRQMPELLQYDSSEDDNLELFQPLKLFDIYRKYVTSNRYPKEYLAAPVAEITHMESVAAWEKKCPVPICLHLPFDESEHIVFNYPEYSEARQQCELRTFDYTHIINNLRFHICNRGFEGVATEAFLRVSEYDHDILPRTIVEDKLDRQNCELSLRFFSEDVQRILLQLGANSEGEFVRRTRNWFEACDKRGMDVVTRLKNLHEMYEMLLERINLSDYPPPTTHVTGIPIRTFEALLHSISSRFSLFILAEKNSYNTRAISTLAVESFFSDMTRYEFSGLGAPKATDIPKLISHVVQINSMKHNPDRGFEFTTSTRQSYPTYIMEVDDSELSSYVFKNHPFDVSKKFGKPKRKKLATISQPRQIAKGGKGIRQYFRIDETKLSAEQRLGKNITAKDLNI